MVFAIYLILAMATYWFISKSEFGKDVQKEWLVENCQPLEISTIKVCFAIFWPLWWLIMLLSAILIFIVKVSNKRGL